MELAVDIPMFGSICILNSGSIFPMTLAVEKPMFVSIGKNFNHVFFEIHLFLLSPSVFSRAWDLLAMLGYITGRQAAL
jgi:hypothetical protein